ncbi:MAG: hypothetical protein Q4F88_06860 [Eubacteriales bacterium]|nr:hypothetical protein [Eubacteriales bacterium]
MADKNEINEYESEEFKKYWKKWFNSHKDEYLTKNGHSKIDFIPNEYISYVMVVTSMVHYRTKKIKEIIYNSNNEEKKEN